VNNYEDEEQEQGNENYDEPNNDSPPGLTTNASKGNSEEPTGEGKIVGVAGDVPIPEPVLEMPMHEPVPELPIPESDNKDEGMQPLDDKTP
jgi:hypothetical protein